MRPVRGPKQQWRVTVRSVGNSGCGTDRRTWPRNWAPNQPRSSERIDGIVAAVMALGRAMVREETSSVYEKRGIIVI